MGKSGICFQALALTLAFICKSTPPLWDVCLMHFACGYLCKSLNSSWNEQGHKQMYSLKLLRIHCWLYTCTRWLCNSWWEKHLLKSSPKCLQNTESEAALPFRSVACWILTSVNKPSLRLGFGTSLVVQRLRLHLSVQEAWVWSLVRELGSHRPRPEKPKHKTEVIL